MQSIGMKQKKRDPTAYMNAEALKKWEHARTYEKELDQEDLDAWDEELKGSDNEWEGNDDNEDETMDYDSDNSAGCSKKC